MGVHHTTLILEEETPHEGSSEPPKDPTTENNPGKGTSKKEKTFKSTRFQKGTKILIGFV